MKFAVTPELATLIKTLRMRNRISAKDLASYIQRSPSYVSKLEKASLKTVREDELTDILVYVSGGGDFYDDVLPAAFPTLGVIMDPARLVAQAWLLQYDVVERMVDIDDAMVDEIRSHLDELDVSAASLAAFISANYDSQLTESFPANQVTVLEYEGKQRLTYRAEVSEREIKQFLCKKMKACRYMFLDNVLFALFRMEYYPDTHGKLPPDEAAVILRCTADYMEKWGIHSLVRFSHLLSSDTFIERQKVILNSQNDAPTRIASTLQELVSADPLTSIKQLNTFSDTLEWDPAFAMKLMGIPFANLGSMSHRNKAQLLDKICDLVDSYEELPDFQKKFDSY